MDNLPDPVSIANAPLGERWPGEGGRDKGRQGPKSFGGRANVPGPEMGRDPWSLGT